MNLFSPHKTMLPRRPYPLFHFIVTVVFLLRLSRGEFPSTRATSLACTSGGDSIQLTNSTETKELFLVNTQASEVCVLWRITLGGARVPVARSYDKNDWEAYSGSYSTLTFKCSSNICQTRLPQTTDDTLRYELTSYQRRELRDDETAARFLEQTTFGPRLDEIRSFSDVSTESFARWILIQSKLPITSHRAEFRRHLNHRFPAESVTPLGRSTHPCQIGTRYRRAAFTDKDQGATVEIRTLPSTQKALFVGSKLRTVVNASQLYAKKEEQSHLLWDGT